MSWFKKTASLNKISVTRLMFHGTSSSLLSSILSEGLNSHHDKVWDAERSKDDSRSRESYGGIYLTDNFMTAYSSASTAREKFGSNRLMVICQLELRTPHIIIDEDKFPSPVAAIEMGLNIASNEWFFYQWIDNGFYDIDKVVESYKELLAYRNKYFQDSRKLDYVTDLIGELIKAAALREAAIGMRRETYYKSKHPEVAKLTLPETESNFRQISNELMQKLNMYANVGEEKSDFMHNVRTLEPINYKGANKVLLVSQIQESEYENF